MNVQHNNLSPVNVLGHPSSGTSLLVRLLREYCRISFGTESQFIVRYYRRLHRYGDLQQDANLRRLIDDMVQERWFRRCRQRLGWQVDPDRVFHDVRDRSYRGVLESVFGQLARHQGMSRWGDKSPSDVHDSHLLHELFPETKFIHIIRDGRDVALSLFGRPFGRKNAYLAARDWQRTIDHIDGFAGTLPADRFCEVRYEDLLAHPVQTVDQLRVFLEIEDADGRLKARLARQLPREIHPGNSDKWRRHWSDRQRRQYEAIAGEALSRHGYDVVTRGTGAALSPFQTSYWTIHDEMMKYTFRSYWQDNLYKLRLHSRDALTALRCLMHRTRQRARRHRLPGSP